jgi:hypothetical protein
MEQYSIPGNRLLKRFFLIPDARYKKEGDLLPPLVMLPARQSFGAFGIYVLYAFKRHQWLRGESGIYNSSKLMKHVKETFFVI